MLNTPSQSRKPTVPHHAYTSIDGPIISCMVSGLGVLLVSLLLVSLLIVIGIQQNNMVLGLLIGMGVIGVMISLRRAYARTKVLDTPTSKKPE